MSLDNVRGQEHIPIRTRARRAFLILWVQVLVLCSRQELVPIAGNGQELVPLARESSPRRLQITGDNNNISLNTAY